MCFKSKLGFSFDFILRSKLSFMFEYVLLVLAFIVLAFSIYFKESIYSYKYVLESFFDCDLSSIAFLELQGIDCGSDEWGKKLTELYRDILKLDMVRGYYELDNGLGGAPIPDLIKVQNKYFNDASKIISNTTLSYNTTSSIFSVNNLKLVKGKVLNDDDIKKRLDQYGYGYIALYLGNNFVNEDIPLGTVYYMSDDYKHDYPFVVEGVLEDSVDFITYESCYGDMDFSISPVVNADNLFVTINDYGMRFADSQDSANLAAGLLSGSGIITINQDYNYDDLRQEIKTFEKKYNAKIVCRSMGNVFDLSYKNMTVYIRMLNKIFYVLVITSGCFIICMQVIRIVNNKKNYGVLISNGADISDLTGIELIELFIKILFTTLIGSAISYCIIFVFFGYGNGRAVELAVKKMLLTNVLWKSSMINALILSISSVIPVFFVSRLVPSELLKEEIK